MAESRIHILQTYGLSSKTRLISTISRKPTIMSPVNAVSILSVLPTWNSLPYNYLCSHVFKSLWKRKEIVFSLYLSHGYINKIRSKTNMCLVSDKWKLFAQKHRLNLLKIWHKQIKSKMLEKDIPGWEIYNDSK